ncbi:Ras- protein Rab-2-B, partial [Cichlidogyrus casuarinus]
HWLSEAKGYCPDQSVLVLVGSKSDLTEERQVSFEEAQAYAKENELIYTEVSSKDATNVENTFKMAAQEIHRRIDVGLIAITNDVSHSNYLLNAKIKNINGIRLGNRSTANDSPSKSRDSCC